MTSRKDKELRLLAKAAHEFSKKLLGPASATSDQYPFGTFPEELLEKAYELDFFHILLPESLGGMEMGITALCNLLEPICRVDASLGGIIFTSTFAYDLILQAAGLEYVARLLPPDEKVKGFLMAAPVFGNPSDIRPDVEARLPASGHRIHRHGERGDDRRHPGPGGGGYMKDFGQEKRFRDARHIQNLLGGAQMKKLRFLEAVV